MAKEKTPAAKPGILDIDIYVPGKSSAPEGVKVHKLSSNETPLGPSPVVSKAIIERAKTLELYPDGQASQLKNALARAHAINVENLICGNGSDEILSLIGAAFLKPGDEVIYSRHGFLMYRIIALTNSAKPVVVDECDEKSDVDAILAAVSEKTRLVFLANPNNPTGTYLPIDEVKRLQAGLPTNVILVLDAAYAEYVRRNDYEAGIELVSSCDNVVMTRTFSKIYGLAALRIGWAYAPKPIIEILERIRGPFNVNALAIAAGTAAIADREHVNIAVEHNIKWLDWLEQEFTKLGLRTTPSVGNFLLIHFPDEQDLENGKTAAKADRFLASRGLILRSVTGYGFPNALRMTVGSSEANRLVIETLHEFMDEKAG